MNPPHDRAGPSFQVTTDWELVRRAGRGEEQGWDYVLGRYWTPIVGAMRRRLASRISSLDIELIAHEFFVFVFERELLGRAEPARGRLRSFLYGVLRNYLYKLMEGELRCKSVALLESDVALDVGSVLEREEEREWALNLFELALEGVRARNLRGHDLLVRAYGVGGFELTPRPQLAAEHGLDDAHLRVALQRARKLLEEGVRELARGTVDPDLTAPGEVEQEVELVISRLLEALPQLAVS